MWGVRTGAAIAVWVSATLCLSACSVIEGLTNPPPLETAFTPQPAPPPPEPPESMAVTPPPAGEARAMVASWLSTAGYRDFQVQALLAHARVESGFQPCAAGPGGFRYLFQWGGTRLQQLQRFAHHTGCPQLRTQLAFADKELRNDPKFSCFWNATTEAGAYAALRRGFGGGAC
jgi:hypothetical protein